MSAHNDEADRAAADGGPRAYTLLDFPGGRAKVKPRTPEQDARAQKDMAAMYHNNTDTEQGRIERSRADGLAAVHAVPTPYRVKYGYMERSERAFATFDAALKFARQKRAEFVKDSFLSVSIYNDDKADGSEDSQSPYGLTEEEREQWEQ